jgi:hypothetical protein
MGDRDSLFEIMTEDEDWMTQLDAAGGLVKIGDRRGYEFLLTASMSDDEEILEVAREIFDSPELARMRRDIETERENDRRLLIDAARKRLAQGGKVFRYKMVYLAAGSLMGNDPLGKGFDIPALGDHGLEGWEVVSVVPTRRALLVGRVDDHFTGAYFLLKREILPSESAELDHR